MSADERISASNNHGSVHKIEGREKLSYFPSESSEVNEEEFYGTENTIIDDLSSLNYKNTQK